jgi:tetratricopeptide (TPR) repeat protein
MMGLFYLLALYAAVRCGTSERAGRWAAATVAATLLALGCKEVAVSIPITVLLYDRAFLAGSFREAWRRRWGMYMGLAAAWLLFGVLLVCSSGRSHWAGYGLPVTWIEYARTQFGVILHYLRLTFWPSPLVLDYHWPVARTAGEILPGAAAIGGLAAATAYALIRWPKWGFVGAWFFLILAPTSSVFPLRDLAFEHRMYLPLAAVVTSVVMGGWAAGQWLVRRRMISLPALQAVGGVLVTCAGVALAILTFERNADYRSDVSIWQDVVAKVPGNARAHNNLGTALAKYGRLEDAIAHCRTAVAKCPDYAEAHGNLGLALARGGYVDEAIAQYRQALKIKPDDFHVMNNLAWVCATSPEASFRNGAEAVTWAQRAIELTGGRDPIVLDTLAAAQAEEGRFAEAVETAQQALALASHQNNAVLAEDVRARIELYQSGAPYREVQQPSSPNSRQP